MSVPLPWKTLLTLDSKPSFLSKASIIAPKSSKFKNSFSPPLLVNIDSTSWSRFSASMLALTTSTKDLDNKRTSYILKQLVHKAVATCAISRVLYRTCSHYLIIFLKASRSSFPSPFMSYISKKSFNLSSGVPETTKTTKYTR